VISTLIDKQDTFEIVRDQIGAILTLESASQQAIALAGSKTPAEYKLGVYLERSNPWEKWLNNLKMTADESYPIVSIWYDGSTIDLSKSNMVDRQMYEATYNIDCYGYGVTTDIPAGGHDPADERASKECQRAVRLVRNILMAGEYRWLGLQGTVWDRWVASMNMFQPNSDQPNVQKVVACRIALRVNFSEFAPQIEPETLELLSVDITRASDGMLYAEAEYDLT
jgi:hypothetical protein